MGAQSSRLVTRDQASFLALEHLIAKGKKTQTALVFATGYQANVAVLSALLDKRVLGKTPLVFADKLNHASLHAGCRLAQAKQIRFRHADYDHLAWLLEKHKASSHPRFIISESVFGMDGDMADVKALVTLSQRHNAFLYMDEAHASGLFGNQGYGLTSDWAEQIDLSMGTFSKALGSQGAYVACSHALKRYLVNRCGGLIYSTAPSPTQIAVMQAAWECVPQLDEQRKQLLDHAAHFRSQLKTLGLDTGLSNTHIIPVILGDAQKTLQAHRVLQQAGIQVSAIRPPSVPPQECTSAHCVVCPSLA